MGQRNWLRELRESKKKTHDEVAKESLISRPYYTQIETGERNPSPKVAKSIARSLGFDWTIFFETECSETLQKQEVC